MNDLHQYCDSVARKARAAGRRLATAATAQKNDWLRRSAAAIRQKTDELIAANAVDLARAPEYGLTSAAIDRLS